MSDRHLFPRLRWLGLTTVVGRWRHHFSTTWRRRINRLSGVLLAGFALWQWAGVFAGPN